MWLPVNMSGLKSSVVKSLVWFARGHGFESRLRHEFSPPATFCNDNIRKKISLKFEYFYLFKQSSHFKGDWYGHDLWAFLTNTCNLIINISIMDILFSNRNCYLTWIMYIVWLQNYPGKVSMCSWTQNQFCLLRTF